MSAKGAEYLKRTCLICGCHTNQTINIYEPRSGPNIVHLIQAKFKFQPLNDDKYLCFSCNNWLINWHSLQALNSNEAEGPSGTFRSHVNIVMQDKSDDQLDLSKEVKPCARPIARISPRLSENAVANNEALVEAPVSKEEPPQPVFIMDRQLSRSVKIVQTLCQNCKRKIVFVSPKKSGKAVKNCRKCLRVSNLHNKTVHNLLPKTKNLVHSENPTEVLPNHDTNREIQENHNNNNQRWQPLPRPILDGKVVSKLRRLGTTLAREINGVVMYESDRSPFSERRQIDDDEILLDFDTAISEVLPIEQPQASVVSYGPPNDMSLSYQMSTKAIQNMLEKKKIENRLPKGLSISLVSEVEGSSKNS